MTNAEISTKATENWCMLKYNKKLSEVDDNTVVAVIDDLIAFQCNKIKTLSEVMKVVTKNNLSSEAKIVFITMLIHADNEIEFTIRNKQIKAVMPHLSNLDISNIWKELVNAGLIEKTIAGLSGNLIKVLI
jgi:transglutaminase/protease-like cytokinesis protein 3